MWFLSIDFHSYENNLSIHVQGTAQWQEWSRSVWSTLLVACPETPHSLLLPMESQSCSDVNSCTEPWVLGSSSDSSRRDGSCVSLALVGSSIGTWLGILPRRGKFCREGLHKKLIPSIESHWKDAVSLVPIDVMSRCNDRYSHSSVAICLRMKDMPRVVSRP